MSEPDVLALAEKFRSPVVDLLRELIHTPSLSSQESAVVTLLTETMQGLGYQMIDDAHGSVVGRIGSGPVKIVYDSHIDTVDVGSRSEWRTNPFDPVLDGDLDSGTIHGRGASDDKGGIASMVYGGALLQEVGELDQVTLYVVGSVQEEECDGLALEHVLTKTLPRPDIVVLGEATRCQLYRGNRGRIEAFVRVKGSSCHASAPHRGLNPVLGLSRVIQEVTELNERVAVDEFLGAGSVAITKIECETPSLNAVPSTATLYIDRRLTEGETPEAALEAIRALPAVQGANAEVDLLTYDQPSHRGTPAMQAKEFHTWVTPADHVGVIAGLHTGEHALGRQLETGHWVFSTNGVTSMGKLGIPTIGFGPGDEVHAHSAHDQCSVGDLVDAVAWYAAFPGVFAEKAEGARA